MSFLNTSGNPSFLDTNFDKKLNFRISVEVEFVLNFNKNKWAILIEPTYQYFKSEKALPQGIVAYVNYSSIEVPVGLRHYFFLNNNSKLFINGSYYVLDFDQSSKINFDGFETNGFEIDSKPNYAFGIGYNYNSRYSIEFRYHSTRDLLSNSNKYPFRYSEYNNMSFIFGYTLF